MASTWETSSATAVTLSGGNLVATNTGTTSADQGARVASADGQSTGKRYFEVTWTTVTASPGGNWGVGVGTYASTYTGMGNGGTTGIHHYRAGGTTWSNGSQILAGAGNWTQGQTAGFAVDLDNRRFWFRLTPSGQWNNSGTADPATNVGGLTIPAGTMVPFITFGGTGGGAGNVTTANFGTVFAGARPSGFLAGWPGVTILTDARATQVAAEQWLAANADARMTQIVLEHWGPAGTSQPQAVATLVALEQWFSVAAPVTTSPQGRAWILA